MRIASLRLSPSPRGRGARTIRLKLTLLYGATFLITGALLLTIGYLLVRHNLVNRPNFRDEYRRLGLKAPLPRRVRGSAPYGAPRPPFNSDQRSLIEAVFRQERADALHRLLAEYAGALVLMTAVSAAAGWLLAGRALAPLREITATARRVSGENLGERIGLTGPQDELKELADTFDGMLARLDRTFASQRHFVANASHELRTPLAIMRTEVDVALADPDATASELRAMGETVRETIDRSEGLISALLTLARSEAVTSRDDPVDLAELAADCITDFSRRAHDAGIAVDTDLGPAHVRGDGALLERMIANLVDNGIRHNEPGGGLSVRTLTTPSARVLVVVRNGGAVIDASVAPSLTEPFRRLQRGSGGFGLGLSIVRSVAEAHGGSAVVAARPEGGLEVTVDLPADRRAIGDAAPPRHRTLTKV